MENTLEKKNIRVWDLPVRLFHWTIAVAFAFAWLTSESEEFRNIHFFSGYYLIAMVSLRIIYGFVGSKYARFSDFVQPWKIWGYIKNIKTQHYLGHNPIGALGVLFLIFGTLATSIVGHYLSFGETELLEEAHEILATATLVVVGIHVLGVILSSKIHKENLPKSMVTGNKETTEQNAVSVGNRSILAILAFVASVAFALYMM